MEYLTPLDARTQSFKEFMEEWVVDQFMKNLAEFELERPWFWDLFVEEIDYAHHSLQLGLYAYRTTLWFDVATPDAPRTRVAATTSTRTGATPSGRSGTGSSTAGPRMEKRARSPTRCRPCATSVSSRPCSSAPAGTPHARSSSTAASICSAPSRAGGSSPRRSQRFADHRSVVDRIVVGEAPGKLTDLHEWMDLDAPLETGKDLRRGLDAWRLEPVPTARAR